MLPSTGKTWTPHKHSSLSAKLRVNDIFDEVPQVSSTIYTKMMLPTLFSLLSVLWWATSLPLLALAGKCVPRNHSIPVETRGWPVLAAFKMPPMKEANFQLGLSRKHNTHTNLTLTTKGKQDEMMLVEMVVESQNRSINTSLMVLLIPNTWSTLKINVHKNKLVVTVVGETNALNYTTRILLDFLHHQGVDAVTSFCPSTCLADVDLQCLYDTGNRSSEPTVNQKESEDESKSQGIPSWPFFLVLFLLVVVCFLFMAWRYQRHQIKMQRRLQAQTEATMQRNSQGRPQTGNFGPSRESNQETRVEGERHILSDRVQYSSILMSFDGPYSGEDEEEHTPHNHSLPTAPTVRTMC
ncbi:uncharacterized protein LOC121871464 [Homarus americanus]|uniref:Uncharacterized protein n=1 Tax=Homarus americanus TaxID=6706 RepID=A0A8J5K150_HOMAM|nr:uncharacterized protein LOC121871464 [Homarus americanus]KAG7164683.1 hypothetical protein Hamer_G005073 [Homarus americanus]